MPVRQKPHAIAQPTCVEMQKVIDGVSGMKTDSMRRPSASSSTNLRVPSIDRSSLDDAPACDSANSSCSACPQRPRQVGHPVEVGDAAPVDPAVDLAGVEALRSRAPSRAASSSAQLQLGQVEAGRATGISIAAHCELRVISSPSVFQIPATSNALAAGACYDAWFF